ncbi:TrmH family RNA methyltransferase [Ampullimonas aquatilis]|uniref:TrmH family RNA methyltransferase n=1 Tax=Ampullimonas aquatilis TaxID=1341549 RepID=UPI003C757F6D
MSISDAAKSISSRDNPTLKRLRLLAESAVARRQHGATILEGIHLAQVWLARCGPPNLALFAESALGKPETAALWQQLNPAVRIVTADHLFKSLSQLETGQGVLFEVSLPIIELPAKLEQSCVILDGVQDPGNVGSILRSAAAAGIGWILTTRGTAQCWAPKVLRAAMGAHTALQIMEGLTPEDFLPRLAVPIIATSSHAEQSIYQLNLNSSVAWAMGNEGAGVSAALQAQVTHWAGIPQPGGEESLNVAAAAAVCLFEQVRQQLQVG